MVDPNPVSTFAIPNLDMVKAYVEDIGKLRREIDCVVHSLTLEQGSTEDLSALMKEAGPGGIVTLDQPPLSVNVEPVVKQQRFLGPLQEASLVAGRIVLPIKTMRNPPDFNPSSIFAAMQGVHLRSCAP